MSRAAHKLLAILSAPVAIFQASAHAETVAYRATTAEIPAQTIQYVAQNVEPTTFRADTAPAMATQSAQTVIETLCGHVDRTYVEELQALNNLETISLSAQLGASAYTWRWPACLYLQYASREHPILYRVKWNDTVEKIERRFVGARLSPAARKTFFTNGSFLFPGRTLRLGYRSEIVPLRFKPSATLKIPSLGEPRTPKPLASMLAFETAPVAFSLSSAQGASVRGLLGADAPTPVASIIAPINLQSSDITCAPFNDDKSIFDAQRIALFYEYSNGRRLRPLSQNVNVLVVDNGFLAVPCDDVACPRRVNGLVDIAPPPFRRNISTVPYGAIIGWGRESPLAAAIIVPSFKPISRSNIIN